MRLMEHGAVGGILALITAFAAPGGNVDYAMPMELVSPMGDDFKRCNVMCYDCENGKHYDVGLGVEQYEWRAEVFHPEECEGANTCEGAGHTQKCETGGVETAVAFPNTGENYETVRTIIATGELAEIATALDADWVSYVAERQSIQVQSCTGTIVANFPVKPEWAKALDGVRQLNMVTAP